MRLDKTAASDRHPDRPAPAIAARTSFLVSDITAGAVGGLTTIAFAVSYTALIYAGPLATGQSSGLVSLLTACLVVGLVTALLSSLNFVAASVDGNSIVILATMAAEIGRIMTPDAPPAARDATILTMLMLTTIAVGLVMTLLGALRIGRFVRFIPYQVMAGFLGAAGWSLTTGGAAVGLGGPVSLEAVSTTSGLGKFGLTVAMGAALTVLVPRLKTPFALPGIILAAVLLYHCVAAGLGETLTVQADLGWLLHAPAHLTVPAPWSSARLGLVDWRALRIVAPGGFAVLLVAVMSLMLNISALEVATAKDADIDRELRAGGIAATASGLLGGSLGYAAVSRSLLLVRAGATTRLAPCVCALVAGIAPILWPASLGLVPRAVLGALLVYLGIQMLVQWVIRSRSSLSRAEWLTVLLVVALTVRFGFALGVAAGVALGCATFVLTYGRTAPTRARYRGDVAASNVTRLDRERAFLHEDAAALLVIHLQGFLFFGTASRLLDDVRMELAAQPGRLRFLVFDFKNVDGIDGSALASFARIGQIAAAQDFVVVLTGMSDMVAARLRTVPAQAASRFHSFANLDTGLEWCEERRLAGLARADSDPPAIIEQLTAAFGDVGLATRFVSWLEPLTVAAGTVVMRQNDLSDELMFLKSGRVSVILQAAGAADIRVRSLTGGSMIGEIAFFLGKPRTATVRTDTGCDLLRLSRATLARIEREDPALGSAFHQATAKFLASRLTDKDAMISALMRTSR